MPNKGQKEFLFRHLVNMRSANVGNGALTEGAERVLNEDIRRPISWSRVPWDDYTFGLKAFDSHFVDLINASDGMIVGGAVTMNGQPHYGNAGMRLDLPLGLWKAIRRPLVFYGISHRHWSGTTYHHLDKLRSSLELLLNQPNVLIAVRNDGTREWLSSLVGVQNDRLHVIPDPAVFVPASDGGDYPEIEKDQRNVILAFNDEDAGARYGHSEGRLKVLKGIAHAIERMLQKWNVSLILAPHYFDDNRMVADFVSICRPQLAHQRMISIGSTRMSGTRHFYGRYRRADLAISMRVHSMSPCIGLGVPMVPVVTQDRLSMFLDDCGLGDIALDARAEDLSERLTSAINSVLADPAPIRRRFLAARENMRQRVRVFNALIQSLVDRFS